MKRMIWSLLLLLGALLFAIAVPGQTTEAAPAPQLRPTITPTPVAPKPAEEAPPETVRVATNPSSPVFGRVLVAETSDPVAGATVTFSTDGGTWHATSDATGAFELLDAGEGWGYLDVTLPEGTAGRSMTGPILLLAERSAPVELVWGVTQADRRPPLAPHIQRVGPIRTGAPVTATIEVRNVNDFRASRSQLTVKAPEGVEIVSAASDRGAVVAGGDALAFRLDEINPGETVTVQVGLQAKDDASAGYHDLTAWLVYGEFVAAQTSLNTTVNGLLVLPQTGLREILMGLLQAGLLITLIVILARHRYRTART